MRVEQLAVDHRAAERRLAQAVTGQFDAGVVHGHADQHFIQADIERAVDADAVISREQNKGALGDCMAWAGHDDRVGVRQHAARQGRAGGDQGHGVLRAGGHYLEVVAAGENARLAGDDDDGLVLHGLVQRAIKGGDDVRGNGVDLAVAQGQGGDAIFEVVGDQLTHDKNSLE